MEAFNTEPPVELVFVKTHANAKLPTKNNDTDTGFDVYSVENVRVHARSSAIVEVGLTVGYITPGYWIRIEGRSGLGFKHGIQPHAGIIDNGYRGNASIKLYNHSDTDYQIAAGDRIAQFVVYKNHPVQISEGAVAASDRGDKGFGSSGK